MLGEKIYNLRKIKKLSQEDLAELIGVTRQTISNWELGETSPNPLQLKQLSKTLNISIDELLDNDTKNILVERVSNTERLAGIIIKILKGIGIAFIIFLIIDIVSLVIFYSTGRLTNVESIATIICKIEDQNYQIEFGTNKYFKCDSCTKEMNEELKKIIDFNKIDTSISNIENYFISNGGICE